MAEPKVTTRETTMKELVQRVDPETNKPDVVYEFPNGRKFEDTGKNGGPYKQP